MFHIVPGVSRFIENFNSPEGKPSKTWNIVEHGTEVEQKQGFYEFFVSELTLFVGTLTTAAATSLLRSSRNGDVMFSYYLRFTRKLPQTLPELTNLMYIDSLIPAYGKNGDWDTTTDFVRDEFTNFKEVLIATARAGAISDRAYEAIRQDANDLVHDQLAETYVVEDGIPANLVRHRRSPDLEPAEPPFNLRYPSNIGQN